MQIDRIDHLVLTVRDIQTTVNFYTRVLGMEEVTFGGRKALRFGNQKINLHQFSSEFEPKAGKPTPGSADLCFITNAPIEQVRAHIQRHGVEVLEVRCNERERMGQSNRYTSATQTPI